MKSANASALLQVQLPLQPISQDVLREKYCKFAETSLDEVQARVAVALAVIEPIESREQREAEFRRAMQDGFTPAGRILSAAGTGIQATLINCFVQPIADAVRETVDGAPSIYDALGEASETMRRGGGVGYDFSVLRPAGSMVKGTHSRASGPLSFMAVFDTNCQTVESAGARRGAQMAVLRVDHPDIEAFIHAKATPADVEAFIAEKSLDDGAAAFVRRKCNGGFRNFNMSVGVTDKFMQAVVADSEFELVHKAEPHPQSGFGALGRDIDGNWIYRRVRARELWDQIMCSTYGHAEPGVLFLDTMNRENNLSYCERVEATNPCAEQPLPRYGCCCLGSVNLSKLVRRPFETDAELDFDRLASLVRTGTRMLDNVLDVTVWPLEKQRLEAMAKRRIGIGFYGLADALVMLGITYGSSEATDLGSRVSEAIKLAAYGASCDLAVERHPFPALTPEYLETPFIQRLPDALKARIQHSGIRNSHLLSIAPTGTIALSVGDNAASGIEPAFGWTFNRKRRLADGQTESVTLDGHALRVYRARFGPDAPLPATFVSAQDLAVEHHLAMLEAVAPHVDAAISKTVNVPADYPYEAFKDVYMKAWRMGLKGITTYRPNQVIGSVLSVATPASPTAPQAPKPAPASAPDALAPSRGLDPYTVPIASRPMGDLEGVTSKIEFQAQGNWHRVYVTVNFARVQGVVDGRPCEVERPVEFFVPASQIEDQQWITCSMRLLSLVARSGDSVGKALLDMRRVVWDKGPVRCGTVVRSDGTEAPRFHDSVAAAIAYSIEAILARRAGNAAAKSAPLLSKQAPEPVSTVDLGGRKCEHCGSHSVRKYDGCDRCDNCGSVGACS